MIYALGFFVDIDDFSVTLSVNCFWNRNFFFRDSHSIPNFESWISMFYERCVIQN